MGRGQSRAGGGHGGTVAAPVGPARGGGALGLFDRYMTGADYDGPYRRINDFVLHDRLGPSIARRLETCTQVAATYGVEYQWPLLDARLIQCYLSTPSIEKTEGRPAGTCTGGRSTG